MGYYRNNREDGFRDTQEYACRFCGDPAELEQDGMHSCRRCWKHNQCPMGNHPEGELTYYGTDTNRGVEVSYCALCSERVETPYQKGAA